MTTTLNTGCPIDNRVPTNLGSQGKAGQKGTRESQRTLFCFSKKSGRVRKHFFNADYLEINICHDFYLKNVIIIISFRAPCETSCKMPEMIREICVQVKEIV